MVLSREPSIKGITKRHPSRLSLKVIARQRTGVGENPRHPRAWSQIDLGALSDNVTQLKKFLSPTTELMAVVKADAYGHGAVEVARTALEVGASRIAIATAEEGIKLRRAGITAPILVLGAINHPEEIPDLCRWDLQPTLCTRRQAEVFCQTLSELNKKLSVHLKLDTGMSRLGTLWDRATDFVKYVYDQPCFEVVSIYSHLATADNPQILDGQSDLSVIQMQHRRFEDAITQIKAMGIVPPLFHLANSAATLYEPSLHYDLVRVGLALYGLYPAPHLASKLDLKPVLQVKARVTQVKTIPKGSGVSYGYKYISDREIELAVVSIGYADGIPRNLSNRLEVLLRGQFVPQIGAIAMEQIMLDVSSIPDVQVGEIVTLIGKDGENAIGAEDWANQLGTIAWEILCGFKHRLPKIYIDR